MGGKRGEVAGIIPYGVGKSEQGQSIHATQADGDALRHSKENHRRQNGNGVRVTDLERSVLDCIDAFEKVCGLEELEACLDMLPSLDEDKLRRYLPLYNKAFLYQKTEYLLEKRQSDLKLSDGFFDFCRKEVASRRYLEKGSVLNKRWNLYVKE